MSIESMMSSTHLILCRPLLLLPSIFPSIKVFSNQSALCIRWQEYWSFSISPSSECLGLISFRIDWFDLGNVTFQRENTTKEKIIKKLCLKKKKKKIQILFPLELLSLHSANCRFLKIGLSERRETQIAQPPKDVRKDLPVSSEKGGKGPHVQLLPGRSVETKYGKRSCLHWLYLKTRTFELLSNKC